MLIKSVLKAESLKMKGLLTSLFLKRVFADEGGDDPDKGKGGNEPAPQINFETLIANARKEEKDKLYPRIKKLEDQLGAMTNTNNENLLRVGELQAENDRLKNNKGESKELKDLKARNDEIERENKTLKESSVNEEELRKKIKTELDAEYEVKLYVTQQLLDHKEDILTVFSDMVQGKTKEEVDTAVKKAVEKTVETKKQLGLIDDKGNPVQTKPVKPTKPPVINPSGGEDDTFDIDYVKNLDPSSKEYAEYRKKIGLK
jgi:hypothetical protein